MKEAKRTQKEETSTVEAPIFLGGEQYPKDGTKLLHYEDLRTIGKGAWGRVYQAINRKLNRLEAVKVLGIEASSEKRKRFEYELKIIAEHDAIDGVVPVHYYGEEKGWLFFAMQLIEGEELDTNDEIQKKEKRSAQHIDEYMSKKQLSVKERVQLLANLCSTVHRLHQRNLIHRDIKPSNVLVDKFGKVWLVDFGIAKVLEDGETTRGYETLNIPGSPHPGTPLYMAPEQTDGGKELTCAADIYALATLAFMILSGGFHPLRKSEESVEQFRTYFSANWGERIRSGKPHSLCHLNPEVTSELEGILFKALAKDPEKRPGAEELREGLLAAVRAIPRFCVAITAGADVGEERYLLEQWLNRFKADYTELLTIEWVDNRISPEERQSIPNNADLMIFIAWYPSEQELTNLNQSLRLGQIRSEKGTHPQSGKARYASIPIWIFQKTADVVQLGETQDIVQHYLNQQRALTNCLDEVCAQTSDTDCMVTAKFPSSFAFASILEERLQIHLKTRFPDIHPRPAQKLKSYESPFRGLEPFTLQHAKLFFGRDHAISQVIMALRKQAARNCTFVLIQGMSGSGKSSLAQAGILHRLIQPRVIPGINAWRYAVMKPSDVTDDLVKGLITVMTQKTGLPELLADGTPVDQIAERLRSHPTDAYGLIKGALSQAAASMMGSNDSDPRQPCLRLALVIDQLEELFTLDSISEVQRQQFVVVLAALAGSQRRVWIVATLRSDFYHRCEELPELIRLKEGDGQYHLLPPTAEEIRQMIRNPVRLAGVTFGKNPQTGLPLDEEIATAMNKNPESLPLGQLVLDELYRKGCADKVLTYEEYQAIGKLEGVLTARAESTFERLPEKAQGAFQQVVRNLVVVSEGHKEFTRSWTLLNPIQRDPNSKALTDAFISARLFVVDRTLDGEPKVSLAHEILLTHWERLAQFLRDEQGLLILRTRLAADAKQWLESGKEKSYLLPQGKKLADAETVLHSYQQDLKKTERHYIEKSRQKALSTQRKLQATIAVLTLLLIVSIFGISFAFINAKKEIASKQKAEQNALLAERKTREAAKATVKAEKNEQLAKKSLEKANHQLGLACLERAKWLQKEKRFEEAFLTLGHAVGFEGRRDPSKEYPPLLREDDPAYSEAMSMFYQERIKIRWISPNVYHHRRRLNCVAFSPDGKILASSGWDSTIRLWNVETKEEIGVYYGDTYQVNYVNFSPNGTILASGGRDKKIRLWDLKTGIEKMVFQGHDAEVNSICFSPDGKTLASASLDGTVRLWDLETQAGKLIFSDYNESVTSVSFSPDGKTLVSAGSDTVVRLWDVKTWLQIHVLQGHEDWVNCVSFSPDGKTLASSSSDKTIRLWNIETELQEHLLRGHSDGVLFLSFSPDGRILASSGLDGTIRLWEVGMGAEKRFFQNYNHGVTSVSFSPDGKTFASSCFDGTIKLWEVGIRTEKRGLQNYSEWTSTVSFSPDGKTLVSGGGGIQKIRLWEVKTGMEKWILEGISGVFSVSFSPDEESLALADDKVIRLWDIETRLEKFILHGHKDDVNDVCFSPDGKTLASASDDKVIRLWDTKAGLVKRVLGGHLDCVTAVRISPDGKTLASASLDGTARLWALNSGVENHVLQGHNTWVNSISFSPDGKTLASAGQDGTLRLWSVDSGREKRILQGHTGEVNSVHFSPDGITLASAGEDKTIKLWSVDSSREKRILQGHSGEVFNVSFSPDGKTLISAGKDGLKVWYVDCIPKTYFEYFEFEGAELKWKLPEPNLYGNKGFHIDDLD